MLSPWAHQFFGGYQICMKYNIHASDNDILKYIKMHVDDGLESLNELIEEQGIQNGFDLIKIIT